MWQSRSGSENTISTTTSGETYLDLLLGSEARADLVRLFHANPGIMDTADGIGRRIGLVAPAIKPDLEELANAGLLDKKKFGTHEVFFLNHQKDEEMKNSIATYLQNVKPTG